MLGRSAALLVFLYKTFSVEEKLRTFLAIYVTPSPLEGYFYSIGSPEANTLLFKISLNIR